MKVSATESLGYYDLEQHKPWFDEECSKGSRLNCNDCRINVKQMKII
jgi:hypothetical protein